jgi:hypothetical protein
VIVVSGENIQPLGAEQLVRKFGAKADHKQTYNFAVPRGRVQEKTRPYSSPRETAIALRSSGDEA